MPAKSLQHAIALVIIALTALCQSPSASAEIPRGEKTFGIRAGFVSRNTSVLGGLTFSYAISSHLRIAPTADIYFRNKNLDALAVSIDMHFPVYLKDPKAIFYPIAGIAFTSWGRHDIDETASDDVSTHVNCLGLNAGAGFEYRPKESLRLSIEARYTLMRHYPTAAIAAGIGFVF